MQCRGSNLNYAVLERIQSEDGKRSNDRFRCTTCIEYGSDDESKTFTRNNKNAHLRTAKHQVSSKIRTQKLEERESARAEGEDTLPAYSDLLSLPEIPSVGPTGSDNRSSDVFEKFRRLDFAFLDENGEQLHFSAGTEVGDDDGCQTWDREAKAVTPECSDAESDVISPQLEWTDYWPYPSKTVSNELCAKNFRTYPITAQMLVLDVLDNMPHLRLSDDHMKSVLWMLEELNVQDTPSLYALRETQKRLAGEMDIRPHEHVSAFGRKFHAVAPEDLLALVGDALFRVQTNHLRCVGLGQPACTGFDAGVPGDYLINQRVVADGEMVR